MLLDINDNTPIFTEPVVTKAVGENIAVGKLIATVTAHDQDSVNGPVFMEDPVS